MLLLQAVKPLHMASYLSCPFLYSTTARIAITESVGRKNVDKDRKSRRGFESTAKMVLFWIALLMISVLFYQVAQRVIHNHQVQQHPDMNRH